MERVPRVIVGCDPGKDFGLAMRFPDGEWKLYHYRFKGTQIEDQFPHLGEVGETYLACNLIPNWVQDKVRGNKELIGDCMIHFQIEDWIATNIKVEKTTGRLMQRQIGALIALAYSQGWCVYAPVKNRVWEKALGISKKGLTDQMKRSILRRQCDLGVPTRDNLYGNQHAMDALGLAEYRRRWIEHFAKIN